MKGENKITGLNAKSVLCTAQKGDPRKVIISNTLSKSSLDKITGNKDRKTLKAKGI